MVQVSAYRPLTDKELRSVITASNNAQEFASVRTCVHCGCTDNHACRGGCSWVIIHKATPTGVCSVCVPIEIKLVDSL